MPHFHSLSNLPRWAARLLAGVLAMGFAVHLLAQQEPQFTQYMFNTLVYNPGFAGSKGYLSGVAVYRDQWFGLGGQQGYDGRPVTQTFSLHSPINRRVALGFNFVNDRTGAQQSTLANGVYAYRIGIGKSTLSVGLQGGILNWRADWSALNFQEPRELDHAFDGANPSIWLPDFGAGIYYHNDFFYAGASMPHLANFSLRSVSAEERTAIRKWARQHRHIYLSMGGAIPLNGDQLVFKPSVLIKSVGLFNEFFQQGNLVREIGAPAAFDLDASLLFQRKLWVGASFRSAFAAFGQPTDVRSSYDSAGLWTAFLLQRGIRIGFAYDYPLNEIQTFSKGSFEVMLGYDFDLRVDKASHPRYFF